MVPTVSYADLEIRILNLQAEGYPVELTLNGDTQFERGYLDASFLPWKPSDSPATDGQRLFDWLLRDGRIRAAWQESLGAQPARRIRLRIDAAAPELHALPWELLHDAAHGVDLAADDNTPFSRYLAGPWRPGRSFMRRPAKVLVAIASPEGLDEYHLQPIDADLEWQTLVDACAGLEVEMVRFPPTPASFSVTTADGGQIDVAGRQQPCTLSALERELRKGYHVLHVVAHGAYSSKDGQALLFLADGENRVRPATDQEIADMLHRQMVSTDEAGAEQAAPGDETAATAASLQLVFLASCQSATRSTADAFRGLAPRLVAGGLPVVLAMQDRVPVDTAREFACTFYRELLDHGRVDLASNQARSALLTGKLDGAAIPVLFMRLADGRLLAPDPVQMSLRAALDQIVADDAYRFFAPENKSYLALPIEVVHVTQDQDFRRFNPASAEPTASIPILEAVEERLSLDQPPLVLLLGDYGSNTSTQLKRMVWETASASLKPQAGHLVLPVYCDLRSLSSSRVHGQDAVIKAIAECLNDPHQRYPYWPGLTPGALQRMLAQDGIRLRLLVDDYESLTEQERQDAYAHVVNFVSTYSKQQCVLVVRPDSHQPERFQGVTVELLIMQRMERRKIRHFLQVRSREDRWASKLLDQLDSSTLFDLAAVPWFLVKMVEQAKAGVYRPSRSQVLELIVKDAIEDVVQEITGQDAGEPAGLQSSQGLWSNVEAVLYALAWQLQSTLSATLPLPEVFVLMKRIRGDREYSLEQLYQALVHHKLLAADGSNAVRFAYRGVQAYCCAQAILQQPDCDRAVDTIVASLGRLTRLHWWEETLVFACGLIARQGAKLPDFLRTIVFGLDLLQTEQAFLAARCLSEGAIHAPEVTSDTELVNTVTTALTWRLDSAFEPRSMQRGAAAQLLGQVTYGPKIDDLVRIAYGKARQDRHRKMDFDHSNVRMAAVVGLLRLDPELRRKRLAQIDKDGVLVALLDEWTAGNVPSLVQTLRARDNVAAQGIAALALGDLSMRLALESDKAAREWASLAVLELTQAFQAPEVHEAALWAVAYALAMIDLPTVRRALVRGGLWEGAAQGTTEPAILPEEMDAFFKERADLYPQRHKFLAYLIGLLRWQDRQPLEFLRQDCMARTADARLAATAIDSLARVGNQNEDKDCLEQIALGQFGSCLPGLERCNAQDRQYVRRKAIDALATVGDLHTIERLRADRGPASWQPELEQALYRTSEEIYWSLNQDRRL